MRALDEARSAVHWGAAHGAVRTFVLRAAQRGDLQCRLILESSTPGDAMWSTIEEIRRSGPLHSGRLSYVTVDHDVVRDVLTSASFRVGQPLDAETLLGRVATATSAKTIHPVEPPSLLAVEPPDHTRYRKLVTRVFTAKAVEQLRTRAEEVAGALLDRLDGSAEADLVEAFCSQLPVTLICEILGVPAEERGRVLALGQAVAPSLDLGLTWRRYRVVDKGLRSFDEWLTEHLEALRRRPGDDLLSQLVAARDEKGTLNDRELKATAGLVLAAGFETTVNLLGNGIKLLHDYPDQAERLDAAPELWPNAVDEVLRLDSPVLLTARTTDSGAIVGGVEVPPGANVVTVLAGANRDPKLFVDPETFDVGRENAKEHLAFSSGRHYCLGASLARMEGEVGLRMFRERFPAAELLPGAQRRRTRILRGWERLPARLR